MTDAVHREQLDRLADIRREIEAHATAIWLLEQERLQVRERLIRAGWQAPQPGSQP